VACHYSCPSLLCPIFCPTSRYHSSFLNLCINIFITISLFNMHACRVLFGLRGLQGGNGRQSEIRSRWKLHQGGEQQPHQQARLVTHTLHSALLSRRHGQKILLFVAGAQRKQVPCEDHVLLRSLRWREAASSVRPNR